MALTERLPSRAATDAANRAALAEADRLQAKAEGKRAYASAVGVGSMTAVILHAALPIIQRDVAREVAERIRHSVLLPRRAAEQLAEAVEREYGVDR